MYQPELSLYSLNDLDFAKPFPIRIYIFVYVKLNFDKYVTNFIKSGIIIFIANFNINSLLRLNIHRALSLTDIGVICRIKMLENKGAVSIFCVSVHILC